MGCVEPLATRQVYNFCLLLHSSDPSKEHTYIPFKMRKTTKGNGGKAKNAVAKNSRRSSSSTMKSALGGPQKILDFALFLETTSGNPDSPRAMVFAMSGVKSNTFRVTLCGMKKKGWIEYDKDSIRLTEEGRARANSISEYLMDNGAKQEDIKARFKIGGKAAVLFDILADGRVHDREGVVGGLGFKSKNSAAVMLCNLKKNGVIEYDKTTIHMADICFPYGRSGQTEE
jgi:hypothetical protein